MLRALPDGTTSVGGSGTGGVSQRLEEKALVVYRLFFGELSIAVTSEFEAESKSAFYGSYIHIRFHSDQGDQEAQALSCLSSLSIS